MSNQRSLERFKYIGYCYSQMPPEEATFEWSDFIQYVHFQLCKINKKLMLDPIWNSYTEAEMLVEYYAHVYQNSPKERDAFIHALKGLDGDIMDWLDDQVKKNQEDMSATDSISFNPESLGDS